MSCNALKTCLKSSLFIVFLLFLQPLTAQQSWNELDAELVAKQKQLGSNLVMMLWKKDDTLVHKKELGEFNSKTQAPVGSSSQWLTAALVMVFVDEGKLSLDDKVSQWLPEFERYGKNYVTLRTCLAHTTGISDKKIQQRKIFSSLEDEVNSIASREIRVNPTEDFWYGNIGPAIAARVLEVVSKKRFDVLIKQKLFTPLAMRRTTFSPMDGGLVKPADGALSTADDMIKFLAMLLQKGKFGGKQVLSEEAVKALMQVHAAASFVKSAPKPAQGLGYALGSWVLEEKDGQATSASSMGLTGTWPVIDFCRGYAGLVFVKSEQDEKPAIIYQQLKSTIDAQFTDTCR